MKPLASYRKFLIWIYACPDEALNQRAKWMYIAFNCVIMAANLSYMVSSVAFMLKYIFNDLELSLFAFFQVVSSVVAVYVHLAAISSRDKMFQLIEGLTNIFTDSMHRIQKI